MQTLERFVQVPENLAAYQAVLRLVSAVKFPLLLLHGPAGTGKSHLVQALVERFTQADGVRTARVLAAAEVGRALLQPPFERGSVRREAIDCDLLVIEDVQHLQLAAGDEIAHILDRRQARRKFSVITAIRGPADLDAAPRLASRLLGGIVVGIRPLGETSRRELATVLCRDRRLTVTDDVIAWLARDPGGARPILGGIVQLEALAKLHPPPLTMAHVTADLPSEPVGGQSALDKLAARVAARFGVDVRSIRGPSRQRQFVWPRQVAMFVARQAGYSFPQIGEYFGGRDHSTVMHGCDKIAEAVNEDYELARQLRELRATID